MSSTYEVEGPRGFKLVQAGAPGHSVWLCGDPVTADAGLGFWTSDVSSSTNSTVLDETEMRPMGGLRDG